MFPSLRGDDTIYSSSDPTLGSLLWGTVVLDPSVETEERAVANEDRPSRGLDDARGAAGVLPGDILYLAVCGSLTGAELLCGSSRPV